MSMAARWACFAVIRFIWGRLRAPHCHPMVTTVDKQPNIHSLLSLHKRKVAALNDNGFLFAIGGLLLIFGIVVLSLSERSALTLSGYLLLLMGGVTLVYADKAAGAFHLETKKMAEFEAQKAANRWRGMVDDAVKMEENAGNDAAVLWMAVRLWDAAAEAANDVCRWETLGAVINFTQKGNLLTQKVDAWEQSKTDAESRADELRLQAKAMSIASSDVLAAQVVKSKMESSDSADAVLSVLDEWRLKFGYESMSAAIDRAEQEAQKAIAESSGNRVAAMTAAKKAAGLAALGGRYHAANKWHDVWEEILDDDLPDHLAISATAVPRSAERETGKKR